MISGMNAKRHKRIRAQRIKSELQKCFHLACWSATSFWCMHKFLATIPFSFLIGRVRLKHTNSIRVHLNRSGFVRPTLYMTTLRAKLFGSTASVSECDTLKLTEKNDACNSYRSTHSVSLLLSVPFVKFNSYFRWNRFKTLCPCIPTLFCTFRYIQINDIDRWWWCVFFPLGISWCTKTATIQNSWMHFFKTKLHCLQLIESDEHLNIPSDDGTNVRVSMCKCKWVYVCVCSKCVLGYFWQGRIRTKIWKVQTINWTIPLLMLVALLIAVCGLHLFVSLVIGERSYYVCGWIYGEVQRNECIWNRKQRFKIDDLVNNAWNCYVQLKRQKRWKIAHTRIYITNTICFATDAVAVAGTYFFFYFSVRMWHREKQRISKSKL